jgi:adenylylsulfate kinase
MKIFAVILDGDELRKGINAGLGFTPEDRKENIRRVAETGNLFVKNGIICIVSTISPYPELRANARKIIGHDRFVEIFVNTPLAVCEARDVKGFYEKARKNLITDFTGVQDSYIQPVNPDLEIKGDALSVEESVDEILAYIEPRICPKEILEMNHHRI